MYEFAMIGAGIVGLSTAIAVGQRYPRAKILVLEKEESIRTGFNRLSINTYFGILIFESAKRYCQAFDEMRNFFRHRSRMGEFVFLSTRRGQFVARVQELQ